jgi:ribose/xylose/arabinose/galactoside ABC-type transport system permease subunit
LTTTAPASRRAVNPETAVNLVLIAALVALCLYFSAQTTTFLTPSNIVLMLQNGAALAVIVVPLAFLMISGKVDLSVGSTVGLSGTIAALACTQWQLGPGWAVVLGLLAGVLVGAINGVLCGILQFNPIIVTLGMLGILRGMTMLIQAGDIYIGNVPIFQQLGNGTFIGVPLLVWIALIVFALGGAFITMTPWGRYVYATGVNPTAAYLSALPVRALPFWLYIVTGAAAGLSGIMMTARISGASPGSEGLSMEMDALTVILLGGVAFAGGRGRLLGVLTAWIFLAALQNGLILMNVTPNVQKVASGATLVVAAALDAFTAILWPRIVQRRSAARRAVSPTGPVSESAIPPSVGNIPAPPVNESLPGKVKL